MILYTTIKSEEINLLDWDNIISNRDNLRYDNLLTRFIISFYEEEKDHFIQFNGLEPMTKEQALVLMNAPEWFVADTEN